MSSGVSPSISRAASSAPAFTGRRPGMRAISSATRFLGSRLSPAMGTSSSSSASRSPSLGALTVWRALITVTPSGTISWACSAAEPWGTPSSLVAFPDTAAAVGTVASTSSWPSARASFRFVRFSDWARNGTHSSTIGPRPAASGFSSPSTSASGTRSRTRPAASSARPRSREPITTGVPAWASRSARPKPSAPVPPMMGPASTGRRDYRVPSAMRLEGKVALVTGAGSGIGAATARRLAGEGASVAATDVNLDGAREVAGEVSGAAFELDVRSTESIGAAVAAAEDELGPIDVLVNNAGYDEFAFFVNTDEDLWDRVLAVNLRGVIAVTHAVLPGMQERGRGRIVNVASEAGRVGSHGSGVYSAAKAGVIGFTKAVAREAARYGVTANAVAPGPIETPLLMAAPEQLGELGDKIVQGMVGQTVLRRLGTPDEVAAAIAFLASDDASFITGQALGVSGGLAMI